MISLASNGRIGDGSPWCGADDGQILYPAVSTCITVTVVAGGKLVGAHLYYGNTMEETAADLAEFGRLATGIGPVGSVYVVGMFDAWTSGARNRTGLLPTSNSLLSRLRTALGYHGGIATLNVSGRGGINIRAMKAGPLVNFACRVDDDLAWTDLPASGFGVEFEG